MRISWLLCDAWRSRSCRVRAEPRSTAGATDADRRSRVKIDFGVRGTVTTGDAARYERYRDLGDGLFLEARPAEAAKRTDWSSISPAITSAGRISALPATSSGPGNQGLGDVGPDPDAAQPHDARRCLSRTSEAQAC